MLFVLFLECGREFVLAKEEKRLCEEVGAIESERFVCCDPRRQEICVELFLRACAPYVHLEEKRFGVIS